MAYWQCHSTVNTVVLRVILLGVCVSKGKCVYVCISTHLSLSCISVVCLILFDVTAAE